MPAGRPIKNGVTFFPLDVVLDDKVELIESEHGIIGFGVVIKLYQKIYADNYYIVWDKKALLVFSNRINVNINSINTIINSCLEWGIFDEKLYNEFSILTSVGIQRRYFEIVKRRKVVEVCDKILLIDVDKNAYKKLINVDINSQRKGKERKKEKNKKKKVFDELKNYLLEKISEELKHNKDDIILFYEYRMNDKIKGKKQPYETTAGIDGLFRDLKCCLVEGYDISECCRIAKENSWLTPRLQYFKNIKTEPVNGTASFIDIKSKQAEEDKELGI